MSITRKSVMIVGTARLWRSHVVVKARYLRACGCMSHLTRLDLTIWFGGPKTKCGVRYVAVLWLFARLDRRSLFGVSKAHGKIL